jgi:hypothetical protein
VYVGPRRGIEDEGAVVVEGSRDIRVEALSALVRAVCTDLRGPVENPDLSSCDGGFLQSFREHVGGFHDLLRQNSSSLKSYKYNEF